MGRALAALGFLTLSAGVVSSCATPGDATTADTTSSVAEPSIPLTSSSAGGTATWATLALGHLGDPDNTFWQLLHLAHGSAHFALATPRGVASNGGLVASVAASGSVLVGFEPSQDLRFSPLAESSDQGANWSPGVLPGGLAPVPDSLSAARGDPELALLRAGGGTVVVSAGDLATWKALVSARTLDSDRAVAACGIRELTGVTTGAFGATGTGGVGTPLVGSACAHGGRPGIFASVGGHWEPVGPSLPHVSGGPSEVIRLLGTPDGATALVSADVAGDARLYALWSTDDMKSWTESPGFPLAGARLTSTGTNAAGDFVIVTAGTGSRRSVSTVDPPSGGWRALVPAPAGTAAVVATPQGTLDALVADQSVLDVYALEPGGWNRVQALTVPVQYGSSS